MPVRAAVGVAPYLAAHRLEAVEAALGERRGGEQCRRDRLQSQRDAQLLDHVGLVREVEVHLDRRGAVHHVEAARADLRHVARHDGVAVLGHVRRLGERPLGREAEPEEADAERLADVQDLVEVVERLLGRLVQRRRRGRPDSSNWPPGSRLDVAAQLAVRPLQRNDLAALEDRLPAEAGDEGLHQRADASLARRRGPASVCRCGTRTSRARCRSANHSGLCARRDPADQVVARAHERAWRAFFTGRHRMASGFRVGGLWVEGLWPLR